MFQWLRKIIQMLTPTPVAIPDNALFIDVRSAGEFQSGHVADAINLPLDRLNLLIGNACADKQQPIVVYCQSGMRSAMARQQLISSGYTAVINGGGVGALALRLQKSIVR